MPQKTLAQYPASFLKEIEHEWFSPSYSIFRKRHPGPSPSLTVPELRRLLNDVFFASLRPDEGRYVHFGFVLTSTISDLTNLSGSSWRITRLTRPLACTTANFARLAATTGANRYLVVATAPRLAIVGIGQPTSQATFLSPDNFPRLSVEGPGHLIFWRGAKPVIRYRDGQKTSLRNDFFSLSVTFECRSNIDAAMYGRPLSQDRETGAADSALQSLVNAVRTTEHGGILAVLPPSQKTPPSLLAACRHRLGKLQVGRSYVEAYDNGNLWNQEENKRLVKRRGKYEMVGTPSQAELEFAEHAKILSARIEYEVSLVGGISVVDGAVILGANLDVLGFGCKLPVKPKQPVRCLQPSSGSRHNLFSDYDLASKGTRHTAAASFAQQYKGGLGLIVSADGPAGCFLWHPSQGRVVFWPVTATPLRK